LDQIRKICEVLRLKGAQINLNCGLHVHIGVRDGAASLDVSALKRLAVLYCTHEAAIIDNVQPPSRRGNANWLLRSIAQHSPAMINQCRDVGELATLLRHGQLSRPRRRRRFFGGANRDERRYVKLNFLSFLTQGTVEFRQHSGTIDANKICQWVRFCQRMVDFAAKSSNDTVEQIVARAIATVRSGTKNAIVCDMLLRHEGCTKREALAATGWNNISVAGIAHTYGMVLRKARQRDVVSGRRELRYWGSNPGSTATLTRHTGGVVASAVQVQVASNLDGFLTMLGFEADEIAFWKMRAETLGTGQTEQVAAVHAAQSEVNAVRIMTVDQWVAS
jgi:hypothetical protein